MRITNNKSSWGIECALDGKDFDEVIMDKAENIMQMEQLGLDPSTTVDTHTVQTPEDDTEGSELVPKLDASGKPVAKNSEDADSLKSLLDAYGVGVRAGALTPQEADEDAFREKLNLPKKSPAVTGAWEEDEGFRRPITLQGGAEAGAEQDAAQAAAGDANEQDKSGKHLNGAQESESSRV
jgi:hypothetical protein